MPRTALALLALAVLHCAPTAPQAAEPVPLYHALVSEYGMGEETVVRDRAAWDAAWARLQNGMVAPPLPAVDFSASSVVLVAIGQRSSGGHDVRVTGVTRDGADAVVRYAVTEPAPGCMTAQMITSPVDVVRVPRIVGHARFERATVRGTC